MKRWVVILSIILAFALIAADLPPQLPSSFYGQVSGAPAGAVVTATVDGYTTSSRTFFAAGYGVVYAIDAMNGTEGAKVVFAINGKAAGVGVYHVGSNQNVNLVVVKGKLIKPLNK